MNYFFYLLLNVLNNGKVQMNYIWWITWDIFEFLRQNFLVTNCELHCHFSGSTVLCKVENVRVTRLKISIEKRKTKLLKKKQKTQCLKITQNVSFEFLILTLSIDFRSIKIYLSGNTVWQKNSIIDHFRHSKCKCCLLLLQCSMRLILWFSNTVKRKHVRA